MRFAVRFIRFLTHVHPHLCHCIEMRVYLGIECGDTTDFARRNSIVASGMIGKQRNVVLR